MTGSGQAAIEAARQRVAATLEAARRVELGRMVVGAPGAEVEGARRRALDAADSAGRAGFVQEARDAAIAYVTQAFSDGSFSGTWAVTEMAMSVTRPADRAAVAEALADTATADAVEDLVDEETAETLRATWASITGAGALSDPSSIANLTSSLAGWSEGRGGWMGLTVAVVLALVGVGMLALGQVFGLAFLAVGAVVLRNALRGRAT
jgi:hypothetical protein